MRYLKVITQEDGISCFSSNRFVCTIKHSRARIRDAFNSFKLDFIYPKSIARSVFCTFRIKEHTSLFTQLRRVRNRDYKLLPISIHLRTSQCHASGLLCNISKAQYINISGLASTCIKSKGIVPTKITCTRSKELSSCIAPLRIAWFWHSEAHRSPAFVAFGTIYLKG